MQSEVAVGTDPTAARRRVGRHGSGLYPYLMVAPALLVIAIFSLLPTVYGLIVSLYTVQFVALLQFAAVGFQVAVVFSPHIAKGAEGLNVVHIVGPVGALGCAAMPAAEAIPRPRLVSLLLPVGAAITPGHVDQTFLLHAG